LINKFKPKIIPNNVASTSKTTTLSVKKIAARSQKRHPKADKFLEAASNGQDKKIKIYVSKGVNVNTTDHDGNTALMLAAKWGRTKTVKLLINLGANRKLLNKKGKSALSIASEENYSSTVKVLKKMTGKLVASHGEEEASTN
jgi:ankyrin repeat protein